MVNSVNSYTRQYNYNTIGQVNATGVNKEPVGANKPAFTSNPINSRTLSNPAHANITFSARLSSKEDKAKYNELTSMLGKDEKKKLSELLKNGTLLNANSNDKSTVLDNLYKIAKTPRAEGLDNKITLQETVNTIYSPFVITQQFGNLPPEYLKKAVDAETNNSSNAIQRKMAEDSVNVTNSGTCVASSIEFNLAKEMPAEFARFAEGLSSAKMSVEKNIKMSNLADNTLDGVWLLNAFEVPYEMKDFNNAKLTFAPDKNAIIRAQMQTKHKDGDERSVVDVLMQSTLMQIGSQQSYDSLTDKRQGKFNQNDKGLIEFEKTFTESVVEDKNKISVTYQTIDENAKLIGYETDFDTMKRHLTSSIDMHENVIIGYTQVDDSNEIINGHEITIIGYRKDEKGKLVFICNDTDDGLKQAIEYGEDYLLPKIHHAALPQKIVQNDVKLVENWVEGLNSYNEMKKGTQTSQNASNPTLKPQQPQKLSA